MVILSNSQYLRCEASSVDFSLLNQPRERVYSASDPTCVLCSDSQLTLLANMTLANQWTLKLPASEAVHHIMTFDPSDRNFLYLMTTHHVRTQLRASARWGLLILVDSLIYSCQHGGRIIMATIRAHSQLVEPPHLNLGKDLQIFGKDPHVSRPSIVSSAALRHTTGCGCISGTFSCPMQKSTWLRVGCAGTDGLTCTLMRRSSSQPLTWQTRSSAARWNATCDVISNT